MKKVIIMMVMVAMIMVVGINVGSGENEIVNQKITEEYCEIFDEPYVQYEYTDENGDAHWVTYEAECSRQTWSDSESVEFMARRIGIYHELVARGDIVE